MNLAIDICFDVRDGPHLVDHFQATRTTIIIIILLFLSYTSYTSATVTVSGSNSPDVTYGDGDGTYFYDYDSTSSTYDASWYSDYQDSWSGPYVKLRGKVDRIPKTKKIIGPAPNLIC